MEVMEQQLLNLRMYGVRDGIQIDDSIPAGKCRVIEEAGEWVGYITNSKDAAILRDIANRRGSTDADLIATLLVLAFMLIPLLYGLWIGFLWLCGVDINAYTQIN